METLLDPKTDSAILPGAVDCDVHPAQPSMKALMPYLDDYLAEQVVDRGIEALHSVHYPPNAPITCRDDWRADGGGTLAGMQKHLFDGMGVGTAILNPLLGLQILMEQDMAASFARGLNDYTRAEWLDRDPRLRASIVVPQQDPEQAAEEIERLAGERRFVQVLMLVMGEMPLGKRYHWPIYKAAEKHGLPVAIHAGSMYRHPTTGVGWSSFHAQDYVANGVNFQTTLTSLITEGVFSVHPNLKVVMSESGVTWLPAYLWRLDKYWQGLRMLIPWVDRLPREIVASNIRFTLQPVDAPPDGETLARVMEHLGSEELLLFSTDYPHWQFDGAGAVPDGLSESQIRKMMIDNPRATYARLEG
ncbi:amidohydrolase family protein [Pseudooceanicola sp. LIPI14-2-Ac024]|uniref:amidohydrolase family protein n=1 Tax=Pseudooceanicola sp. LIPI14-2-Ac024 TaxID=3344875 RepID=UPI0035CEFF2A